MISAKTFIALWSLCLITLCSHGAQEPSAQPKEITTADIKWVKGEPQEITDTAAYKRWVKDFGVIDARLAKELDYTNHSIRYVHMDVTNDGRNEVLVQEGSWAASGYAFAIFDFRMGGYYKGSELCSKSLTELRREYFQSCDDADVKAALSQICRK